MQNSPSNTSPSRTPTKPAGDKPTARSAKPSGGGKAGSKRSANQGEKKTTP